MKKILLVLSLVLIFVSSAFSVTMEEFLRASSSGDIAVVRQYIKDGGDVNVGKSGALIFALSGNHTDVVKFLLENGIEISNDSILISAVANSNVDLVKLFIAKGINVNYQDNRGNTALTTALYKNDTSIVTVLINAGANLNNTSRWNDNAFAKGDVNTISLLIDAGLNINANNSKYLQDAIYKERTELAKLLISKGINVDITYNRHGKSTTPLLEAFENNNIEIVKQLMDSKIDVNSEINSEVLYLASEKGNTEVVKLLVDAGAKANYGSPLHKAYENGHNEVVKLLVNNNIDSNGYSSLLDNAIAKKDTEMITFLANSGVKRSNIGAGTFLNAVSEGDIATVEAYIEQGNDVNARYYRNNKPAIITAIEKNDVKMVKLLVDNKANLMDSNYPTLPLAIDNGNTEILKLLIDGKVDINADYYDGHRQPYKALRKAFNNNNMEVMKVLIDADADINADRGEMLYLASEKGSAEVVKLLVDADVEANYGSPINTAYGQGCLDIVKFLLSKNVDSSNYNRLLSNAVTKKDKTTVALLMDSKLDTSNSDALNLSINNGDSDMAKYLIEKGFNLNYKGSSTALITAIEKDNREIAKLILTKGCDIDTINTQYSVRGSGTTSTALILAVQKNYTDIIKLIIEKGGDINFKTNSDTTALSKAFDNNNMEMITLLIEAGATLDNLNSSDKKYVENITKKFIDDNDVKNIKLFIGAGYYNLNVLIWASRNGNREIVKLLISKEFSDYDLALPLGYAILNGHIDIVKLFINTGIDVNYNRGKDNFLEDAIDVGHTEIVKLLIDAGANVNVDRYGETALTLIQASGNGYTEIVKLLIDAKSDVNVKGYGGETALIRASRNGHVEIVQLLVNAKADVNAQYGSETALTTAFQEGHDDIVKILQPLEYVKEDGGFDWQNYMKNSSIYYYNTDALSRLFKHYDKVKNNPFQLGTLSNNIVSFYNSKAKFNEYNDVVISSNATEVKYYQDAYKILHDNIDKFDVVNKKEKKQSMEQFVNNQINEATLFYQIRSAYLNNDRQDEIIKIELRNSDDKKNGLVIKYNGEVVDGILGNKRDFEYTIDYNGKKNVKIKLVKINIYYNDIPTLFGVETSNEKKEFGLTGLSVLMVGNRYCFRYYDAYDYYASDTKKQIFLSYKIRDWNKHEDGITRVEIAK